MRCFSVFGGMRIYTVTGNVLIILLLGLFIVPHYTAAQSGKTVAEEKQLEGSLTALGKDYIVVDGKKYMVSKELKIKDQKGRDTSFRLDALKFVHRLLLTLQNNMVIEIQIISYTS